MVEEVDLQGSPQRFMTKLKGSSGVSIGCQGALHWVKRVGFHSLTFFIHFIWAASVRVLPWAAWLFATKADTEGADSGRCVLTTCAAGQQLLPL